MIGTADYIIIYFLGLILTTFYFNDYNRCCISSTDTFPSIGVFILSIVWPLTWLMTIAAVLIFRAEK